MANDLERFFKSIDFLEQEYFLNTVIEKVIYLKEKDLFKVYLKNKEVIPFEFVNKLLECASKGIKKEKKCLIIFEYENIESEMVLNYLKELISELGEKRPSLITLKDSKISIEDEIITIEVGTKLEELEVKKESKTICKRLFSYGLGEYELTSVLNEELHNLVKNELEKEQNKENVMELIPPKNIKQEKSIEGEVVAINNIMGDVKSIIIEAYVFGIDTLEHEKINIITLKISDKTNSLLAKIFKKDKGDFKAALGDIKEGAWYRFKGSVEFDTFSKDLVLKVRKYEAIDSKEEVVKESRENTRVELHLHTMMSAMDSVVPYEQKNPLNIVKYAASIGQKAVAITDHNCCQAFPEVYHTVEAINKGKEGKERFKALYGAEMNIVNDDVDIIFNNREFNLLEETFVVFDTETTGFYAGSDQMIEIGAVKIQAGKIIDRFDELIDPHRAIPKKLRNLLLLLMKW